MGQRVLVVDDRASVLEVVGDALRAEGFSVLTAANGAECLRATVTQQPDLVILDVMMPDLDGLQVLRAIRLKEATRRVPVIMLTARGEQSDVLAGRLRGADEYLTKPCSMIELVAAVKRVLATAARRAAESQSAALAQSGYGRARHFRVRRPLRRYRPRGGAHSSSQAR